MTTTAFRCATALCLLATSGLSQVNWTQASTTLAPTAIGGSAWDSVRGRLVAYGGDQAGQVSNLMREWNGTSWSTLNPTIRPSARRRPAMAFDAARGVTVLFGGGFGTSSFLNDTWTWDGTTWTQRTPTTSPSLRFGAAMAYDSDRQVVVLFGGFVPSGQDIADTWEWNGTNWTLRQNGGPTPRGAHRMAYDQARGVVVMYGGYSTPAQVTLADTWLWDGSSWSTGLSSVGPGTLCDQLLVDDWHRQRVVMFGGLRLNGAQTPVDLNGLWEWDGLSWTQRTTQQTPVARSGGAVGFDPASGRVVLGGGTTGGGFQFGDTWTFRAVQAATTTTFGNGCPTSAGAVGFTPRNLPYVGVNFDQRITNAPAAAVVGIVLYGVSNAPPLPFDLAAAGAPGCSLNVSLDLPLTVLLSGGVGQTTWALPNVPSAAGTQFYTQGFVFDPASTLLLPIGASIGLGFTIGVP